MAGMRTAPSKIDGAKNKGREPCGSNYEKMFSGYYFIREN